MLASPSNGAVQLWRLAAGKATPAFRLSLPPEELDRLCFSRDGRLAALGKTNGVVEFYDCAADRLTHQFKAGEDLFDPKAISPNEELIVLGRAKDAALSLWHIQSATERVRLPDFEGNSWFGVSFSADSRLLAYAASGYVIRVWDVVGNREALAFRGHNWSINCVNFSPDGTLLLSTSIDDDVRLWDVRTGRPFGKPLKGHTQGLRFGQFTPDGRTVLTADQLSVRMWNVRSGQEVFCECAAGDFLLAPDGSLLALISHPNRLRLVEIPSLAEIDQHPEWASANPR